MIQQSMCVEIGTPRRDSSRSCYLYCNAVPMIEQANQVPNLVPHRTSMPEPYLQVVHATENPRAPREISARNCEVVSGCKGTWLISAVNHNRNSVGVLAALHMGAGSMEIRPE